MGLTFVQELYNLFYTYFCSRKDPVLWQMKSQRGLASELPWQAVPSLRGGGGGQ